MAGVPRARQAGWSGFLTRLFVFFGGLLSLALIAALVAPYFIDWTQYRTDFEREATRILGQPVKVAGDASARLLPFPSVTFEDVRVGPPDKPLVVADKFSMDAELAPFMQGEVLIYDMRLENPKISLEIGDDGMPNWPIQGKPPVNPAHVTLENARIVNGSVTVHDATAGRTWQLDHFHASVSANSLYGPFRIEGDGRLNENPLSARVTTGKLSADGFALRTVLDLPRQNIELIADGHVAVPDEERKSLYDGGFTMEPLKAEAAPRYRVEGNFNADARGVEVPEFRADFGSEEDPYTVTGDAEITGTDKPRYAISVKGTQITLDGPAEGETAAAPKQQGDPVISLAERLQAVQSILSSLPFPPIPGSVDLDLPAVVAGDTTIRDIQLKASPDDGDEAGARRRWKVSQFEAKLPGRSVIEADGVLQLPVEGGKGEETQPGFAGNLLLASRQPSGLASWLTGSVDDAIRRLPNAGFSAKVDFTPQRQTVRDLEVIIGPARMRGSMTRIADPDRRDTLDVALTGEKIDVDALQALASVFVGDDGVSRFAEHDLDLSLDLTEPDIRGVALDTLSASIRSRQNKTEIDKLSLTGLYGASVSATATLENRDKGRRASVDATVVAGDGGQLVEGLANRFPGVAVLKDLAAVAAGDPDNFADTRLDVVGTVATKPDADGEASLSISGTAGGTNVSLTTTADGRLEDSDHARIQVNGTLDNPAAERLLSQAGFDVFVIDSPGPLEAELKADGTLADGLDSSLVLTGGDMVTDLSGVVSRQDGSPAFEGKARVEAGDIEPWVSAFGYRLPGMGLGTSADLRASVSLRDGTRVIEDIEGTLNGGSIAGTLAIDMKDNGPQVRGDISLEFLNAGELYALATGDAGAAVIQASPEEAMQRLFEDPMLGGHDIEVALNVAEVTLPLGDEPLKNASGTFIYRNGQMAVRNLDARYGDGRAKGLAELQNTGGTVLLNAQLNVEGARIETLLPPAAGTLRGTADASLQLTGTGRSTEALLASLTGSGVVKTDAVTVKGIRADGFPDLIGQADEIGYKIEPTQIRKIAAETFFSGETELPPSSFPVTATDGTLRISNASVEVGRLTLSADAGLEAVSGRISGTARLTLDPGEEAVAGPQPEVTLSFATAADGGWTVERDYQPVVGYVTQRALEREQARVEAMQARLLEKQRLRREVRLYEYRKRTRLLRLEEERRRAFARERAERKAEEDQRRASEEDAARINREAEQKKPAGNGARSAPSGAGAGATDGGKAPEIDMNRFQDSLKGAGQSTDESMLRQ